MRRPDVTRSRVSRSVADAEIAAAEAAYTHTALAPEPLSLRRARVAVTLVRRTCSECGRTALDVRAPWQGTGPLCSSGTGCQGRADRAVKRGAL